MVINKKKVLIALLILMLISPFVLYYLKSLNINGTDFPCLGGKEYSVGDFLEKNIDKQGEYYYYQYPFGDGLDITEMHSGNINSMKGLSDLSYANDIDSLFLDGTCISEISDLEGLTNLEDLSMTDAEISKIDGMENMNSLTGLYLSNNNIETIENIENIRTDTSEHLTVFVDGNPIKYMTQESYDYIMDEGNDVSIYYVVPNTSNLLLISPVYGDSKEKIEEYIEII